MKSTESYSTQRVQVGVRDWSLITGRGGGATKREGGCKVLAMREGGEAQTVSG